MAKRRKKSHKKSSHRRKKMYSIWQARLGTKRKKGKGSKAVSKLTKKWSKFFKKIMK